MEGSFGCGNESGGQLPLYQIRANGIGPVTRSSIKCLMPKNQTIILMENDNALIRQSLTGDKSALETLIKKHQTWVFNVALNLTANSDSAADLTQEVLIKMVTGLANFNQESSLHTWLYRIIKNHFLNGERAKQSREVIPWQDFADGLASIPDEAISESAVNRDLLVEEAKLSCMKGMLLCLSPDQRFVFVMGELFELNDRQASEVLSISKAAYRKRLSRARTQLYNFMNHRCGLINSANPCRCARKVNGFIQKGYIDPEKMQFQSNVIEKISEMAKARLKTFEEDGLHAYKELFQSHYYQKPANEISFLQKLMSSEAIKGSFDLN